MEILLVMPIFLIVCLALLAVLAYTPVNSGEVFARIRFGKYQEALRPGWNWIVPFLDDVKPYSTKVHQVEFPAEPEQVAQRDEEVKEGKQMPFRVAQKGMKEARYYRPKADLKLSPEQDPLEAYDFITFNELPKEIRESMEDDSAHAALTSVVGVNVEWYIMDDNVSVGHIVENIDDGKTSVEQEINRRLNDYADRAMRELLGTVTAGHTQERLPLFNDAFKFRLEVLVGEKRNPKTGEFIDKPWGIHIASASIKSGDLGVTINRAKAIAAAAVSERNKKVRDSEAEATSIVNLANATAKATRENADAEAHRTKVMADAKQHEEEAKGKGEAARIKAMAEVMHDPNAKFIAQLDVAEQALTANGRTLFVPTQTGMVASILGLSADLADESKSAQPRKVTPQ